MHKIVKRQSYHSNMQRYAVSATPVSKISVVNLRMPSTQSFTSRMAFRHDIAFAFFAQT